MFGWPHATSRSVRYGSLLPYGWAGSWWEAGNSYGRHQCLSTTQKAWHEEGRYGSALLSVVRAGTAPKLPSLRRGSYLFQCLEDMGYSPCPRGCMACWMLPAGMTTWWESFASLSVEWMVTIPTCVLFQDCLHDMSGCISLESIAGKA